ncbi:MAG: PQQ-dependent sugar dehydrogenase, partial [Aeromicrobium sp.]
MKDNYARVPRRRRILATLVATGLAISGLTATATSAAAHPGHEHPEEPGAEAALDWSNYEKVLLTRDVGEPIDMTLMPDGTILHTARNGDIRQTDPSTGVTKIISTIPVYANSEDGLQSIGIDPDFAENQWVYLVYAPLSGTPSGNAPTSLPPGADEATYWDQWLGVNRLSRFQWTGTEIDLATEQTILEIPVQRGQCCHVGADFGWDADGNMYLGTGDNTAAGTPGSNGFAPNNDAPGMNPGTDARRGAGNTNDLRGKILRFTVQEDGSYTIPEGNLFEEGLEGTRPEIFVMGVRNPFKIDVDIETNSLSWGDYGPDATSAAAADGIRGPMGYVEWNTTPLDEPINAGWPYVHGDNFAYNDWDFENLVPREFFDPENLVNTSRWNTGLTELPPATPATAWYGDDPGDQPFDEFVNFGQGRGQAPMGGPVYHYDAELESDSKLPEYWDKKAFMGEFSQDYVAALTVDWETSTLEAVEDFMPNAELETLGQPIHDNPMDLQFGDDGSLYALEYGDGFFRANPDAGLYRISYAGENKSPQASFTATPISASSAPLTVEFDASSSVDPDGDAITYEWDFDGDGDFDAEGVEASYTYEELGLYTARLRVTDERGKFTLTSTTISVGNEAPVVTLEYPQDGAFFEWGQSIPFQVTTQDAEDGTNTDCTKVSWTYGLGHDEHAHPEVQGTGCTGVFPTSVDSPEHGPGALLYGAVVVTYTDRGANGLPGAIGETTLTLNPSTQEFEHAKQRDGVESFADSEASGGNAVRTSGEGSVLRFNPVSFEGVTGASVRSSGEGELQLRWDAADAEPFATVETPAGDGWQSTEVDVSSAPEGSGQLFVTTDDELELDAMVFEGGVGDVAGPDVTATLSPETPTGAGGVYNEPVTLTVGASDIGGVASVEYSVDGGETWTAITAAQGVYAVTFDTDGERTVQYRATDRSGNVSEIGEVAFTIDLDAPNEPTQEASVDATVAAPRVTYGAPGSVTVEVSGDEAVPTGEVVVSAGSVELGRADLAEGSATVELARTAPVGTHVLTVAYSGDGVYVPSTDTARLTITKAASVLTASVDSPVKPAIASQVTVNAETSTGLAGTGTVTVHVKRNLSTVATL